MHSAELIIEPMPDADALSELTVTAEERTTAASFGSERRRCEYLMWRSMIRRRLGSDTAIGYDSTGAPVLLNRPARIGVSHCSGFVAVVISDNRCAVDIESVERDFQKISSRYISRSESGLSDDPRLACALWCAKETLYKYAGRTGLDFLRDICVETVDFERGIVVGRICGGDSVLMRLACCHDCLVVWVG